MPTSLAVARCAGKGVADATPKIKTKKVAIQLKRMYYKAMTYRILFTKQAQKGFASAPPQVKAKLNQWISDVRKDGLSVVRQAPTYRDEPLKGQRQGEHSIRLNHQWRAIYKVEHNRLTLTLLEVTPHDYRTR
jgi:proteic killer suppression protein